MRKLSKKSKAIVAIAAVIGLAGSGAAYAYWTTSGTGTGTAASGTVANVTLEQTAAPSALLPGVPQPLTGTFNNPNTSPVYITSVSAVVDPSWFVGVTDPCNAADFTVVSPTTAGVQALVNDSTVWSGGSIELINKPSENQDACKNLASIPLIFTSN